MTTAVAKRIERGERTERRRPRTRHSAQRPQAEAGVARREGSARADDGPTPSTLAESLERAWEDLTSRGRAECLVCGGDLTAAACRDCGSSLA